jgi:glycosyltransferase involved in cell wall biosynthesis
MRNKVPNTPNKNVDVKLALNMILKYDEPVKIVKRALDSILPYVDGAYITVTYSDKKPTNSELVKYLKKRDVNVSYFKWVEDFAAARNFNMKQVPEDYLYITWIDADDVLRGGERIKEVTVSAHLNGVSSVFFNYWYKVDLDDEGNITNVVIEHKRERIFANDGTYKWVGRLHETLIPQRQENVKQVYLEDLIVIHLSSDARSDVNLERNRRILESTLKEEDGRDPRTKLYLAKVYLDMMKDEDSKGKLDEAAKLSKKAEKLFKEYIEGKGEPGTEDYREPSGWDEERAVAWSYLGEIYKMRGQYDKSTDALYRAINEDPKRPRYYLDIAMNWLIKEEWDKAEQWLKMGLNTPVPQKTTMILNPRDIKAQALEIAYHIAVAKEQLDVAVEVSNRLKKLFPKSETINERLEAVNALKSTNKAAQCIVYLVRYLDAAKEYAKIPLLLKGVPSTIANEKFVSEVRNAYLPPKTWDDNEIAIFCGLGFEPWSPKSLATGLGGSETAVVRMSKELTDLGYKVTVYADPQDDAGDYDGVEYKPWHDFNKNDEFNIMIFWRAFGMLDYDVDAKAVYLWAHDVPNNAEITKDRLNKVDKIMALTNFHRSLFRMNKNGEYVEIPDKKFFLTSNGIAPVKLSKKIKREPHRMVWASSYDRGLINMLKIWPDVIEEVPDAKLDIYYGWNLFESFYKDNPAKMEWKNKVDKLMKQKGITHHGRVGKKELWEAYQRAGIWAYSTAFEEINCHLPGTFVETIGGDKLIEDLNITDKVRGSDGSYYKVTAIRQRSCSEKVYEIVPRCGETFRVTGEHPILAIQTNKADLSKNFEDIIKKPSSWVGACELKKEDIILSSKRLKSKPFTIDLEDYKGNQNCNNFKVDKNDVNENFDDKKAWWFGYFVGDGNANMRGKVSCLVVNNHMKRYYQKVVQGFKSWGLPIKERKLKGCVEVYAHSYQLSRYLRDNFYDDKGKKFLPVELLSNPLVLEGLLAADGSIYDGYKGTGTNFTFTNTSRKLIGQVRVMINILRDKAGRISTRIHKNGDKSWSITWVEYKDQTQNYYMTDKNYLYYKIRKIKEIDYDGPVYNIDVEKIHDYHANGVIVHNCIVAQEAQAYGAIPVCTDYAALKEKVKHGIKVPVDIETEAGREEYKKELIGLLKDTERQEKIREPMMKEAQKEFLWSETAKGWDKEFKEMLNKKGGD